MQTIEKPYCDSISVLANKNKNTKITYNVVLTVQCA